MKIRLTPTLTATYIIIAFCISLIVFGLCFEIKLPHDTIVNGELRYGVLHAIINFLWIACSVVFAVWGLTLCDADNPSSPFDTYKRKEIEYELKLFKMKKNKIILWSIIILSILGLYNIIKPSISDSILIYNKSVQYKNLYKQKSDEKMGFYDKLWKVYLQKNQIAELNKDVFIEVTKIIMQGRADGDKVAWKWVQENQQIPYDQFTKFYADLSGFVFSQREAYFNIEKECMNIANQNNTMLDTFPNNIYNKVLKCEKINFKYSFTSKKTKEVFSSEEENIE
jgi:hypothetical protein